MLYHASSSSSVNKKKSDNLSLAKKYSPQIKKTNQLLLDTIAGKELCSQVIPAITKHITQAGGKRLRALLTIACAELLGYGALPQEGKNNILSGKEISWEEISNNTTESYANLAVKISEEVCVDTEIKTYRQDAHLFLAASVELLHTATLLHDDVVDVSEKRRGIDTANIIWGNKSSILVGDYLLGSAFHYMVQAGSFEAMRLLSQAAKDIADGEIFQLDRAYGLPLSMDDYLKIISGKTASLFAAACGVGAVIACKFGYQDNSKIKILENFGRNIGYMYQIIDDHLDYFAKSDDFGKNLFSDLAEGKNTLPLILLYRNASLADKERVEYIYANYENSSAICASEILYLMQKYQIESQTMKIATDYLAKAKSCLEQLAVPSVANGSEMFKNDSVVRLDILNILYEFCDELIQREF